MSNKKTRVLCIGEAMLELSLNDTTNAQVDFAGDTLNTAVYLKRLSRDSLDISYCTVVGQDALSERLRHFIQAEEINTDTIRQVDDRTIGLYAINTDEHGERTFTYWRNQSAARRLFQSNGQTDFSVLQDFNLIYLSAITLAILPDNVRQSLHTHLSTLRAKKNTSLAFDSNYRPALWESQQVARTTVDAFWQITDIALPSIDDERDLFNDNSERAVLDRFAAYGIAKGALKRGHKGALSLGNVSSGQVKPGNVDPGKVNPGTVKPGTAKQGSSNQTTTGTLESAQHASVDVIDTTAAGDSFNAGYLNAVLAGCTQSEALSQGHSCAIRVITQRGAIIPKALWSQSPE